MSPKALPDAPVPCRSSEHADMASYPPLPTVRNPEGSICLYTKGADTVILERLHSKGVMETTTEEVLAVSVL